MKKLFFVIILNITTYNLAFCQNPPTNLNELFYENCVLISYNLNGSEITSSGFLIFKSLDIKKTTGKIYLITTKHTLSLKRDFTVLKLRFFRKNYSDTKERMEFSVPITDRKGYYLPKVQFNKKGADIAAIDITDECVNNGIKEKGIPTDLLISKSDIKSQGFTVGDEIYTIGYPDGIYDEKNYSPLFRYGIISTLPYENYNFSLRLQKTLAIKPVLNGFLIDANVYPGSSGSLVIFKTLNNSFSGISFGGGKATPYVFGMVSGSIPYEDFSSNNIQRMGIGIVCSSESILETITFGIRLPDE